MSNKVSIARFTWEEDLPELVVDLWKAALGNNMAMNIAYRMRSSKGVDAGPVKEAFNTGEDFVNIDYLQDKPIKIMFFKDEVTIDASSYDREHGEGTCQTVVAKFLVKKLERGLAAVQKEEALKMEVEKPKVEEEDPVVAAKKALAKQEEDIKDVMWKAISVLVGYEGSAGNLLVKMANGGVGVLFSISKKKGVFQAEIQGGKPEPQDGGDPILTVIREVFEECGVLLKYEDFVARLQTTGGKTGVPSYQYLTKVFEASEINPTPKEKFERYVVSKYYYNEVTKEWYIMDGKDKIAIRNFNCFFLNQNLQHLVDRGLVVVVTE